jgi:hypothetical protein
MEDEHLEPVHSLTPDGSSRARTMAAAILPAVVLIAVIGAAILGGGSPSEPTNPEQPAIASAEPIAETSLAPGVEALQAAGFPTRALGLPVHSVARTLALRDAGEIQDRVVAVAGWLSVPPDPACGVDVVDRRGGQFGTGGSCRRQTVLADDAEPMVVVRGGSLVAMRDADDILRPVGLPGPSLSTIAAGQVATDDVINPARAVVLGRFADPRLEECTSSHDTCGSTFAIERVAWVDGSWKLRRPLIYPAAIEADPSGTVRWTTVDRAIRRGAIVLSEVVAPREDLATLDPAADAATPRDVGTVWYVRVLLRERGVEDSLGDMGWAVIDDDTARVLAADPERQSEERESEPPGASASPNETPVDIPARMVGLDVIDVEGARRMVDEGIDPDRLVAIDGWLTVAPDEPGCTELPLVACPRRGDLSATRKPGGQTLSVETLAGTPLLGLTRQNPSLGTWTVPNRVVVVGHFRTTGPVQVFTIERLAWLRTAARDRPILTAPGSLQSRWTREAAERTARDAIDGAGATLLLALVDRPTLRLFDEAAWDASGGTAGSSPVWYLRTIAWPAGATGDAPPVIGWSVVDDRSHDVLASRIRGEAP